MADIQHKDLTSIHPFAFVSDTEPIEDVTANKAWIDTSDAPANLKIKLRNEDNDAWIVLYETSSLKALHVNYTPIGNIGAGEDNLMSFNIPNNTLGVDGEALEVIAQFNFESPAQPRFKIAGIDVLTDNGDGLSWGDGRLTCRFTLIRIGIASLMFIGSYTASTGDENNGRLCGALTTDVGADVLTGIDFTDTISLQATGQGTTNDDIQQTLLYVGAKTPVAE